MQSLPPPFFVADAPGLDFLNTVATDERTIDWLRDGDGLLYWLGAAKIAPSEVLAAFRAKTTSRELDAVAEQARALREWFREFVHEHMGRPLRPDAMAALTPLNKLLKQDTGYGQIARANSNEGKLELRLDRHWNSPNSLLLPIGTILAQLVCDEDFSDVKACQGHNCTLLFADHTRGRARRWCSMAVCGNRAKQAAHRDRVRTRQ